MSNWYVPSDFMPIWYNFYMKRLKELREEKGLHQIELAKILNVTQTAISRYEKGERTPDIQTIKKLRDFFGVTTDYLLGFEEY